nr:hypothetical protein [Nocardia seriolae]
MVIVIASPRPAKAPQPYALSATRWIARSANRSAQGVEHFAGEVGFGRAAFDEQGRGHRQRDRPRSERQSDHDRQNDPVVAEPELGPPCRGAVVEPARGVDAFAAAPAQRVIDRDRDRGSRRKKLGHNQFRDNQAELGRIPASGGEEPVRTGVVPHPCQAGAGEHPAHGAGRGLGEQARHQHGEGSESRCGETLPQREQDTCERDR